MKIINQTAKILWPLAEEEGRAALRRCEYGGRVCYNSVNKIQPDSYKKFTENLYRNGHCSPLEHAFVTVEFVTGRDVLAELTRHRLASFSVESQRYVLNDATGDISFIKPLFYIEPNYQTKDFTDKWYASRIWENSMKRAETDYICLVHECNMPPEDARKVLPNSVATRIVMSCNIRELLHILDLRTSQRAYPEIRELMSLLEKELERVYPHVLTLKELKEE